MSGMDGFGVGVMDKDSEVCHYHYHTKTFMKLVYWLKGYILNLGC